MTIIKQALRRITIFLFVATVTVLGSFPAWAIVIQVNNTNDSGGGSLRAAINSANALVTADAITFNPAVFPSAAPAVISVGSTTGQRLPRLTGAGDSIDGTGAGVIIDGSLLPADPSNHGLRIQASNTTVRGVTIQSFPGDGIRVAPNGVNPAPPVVNVLIDGNTLGGNFDGMRVSGDDAVQSTVDATILGNLLENNNDDGIFVLGGIGATANTVTVNILNNTIKGSKGMATGGQRTGDGIRVIGGNQLGAGHDVVALISGNNTSDNADDGILVAGSGGEGSPNNNTVDTTIVGNFVKGKKQSNAIHGNGIVVRGGQRGDVTVADSQSNVVTFIVSGNKVFDTKDFGISISGGQGMLHTVSGTATNNVITRTGDDGVRVTGGSGDNNSITNITLQNNRISNSAQDGLQVTGGGGAGNILSGILIDSNRSERNSGRGYAVTPGSGSVSILGLTANLANANGNDGIFIGVPGSSTPVSANQTDGNGQDGIDIDSTGYILTNNSARRNVADGINAVGNFNGGGNSATGNELCNTPGCF